MSKSIKVKMSLGKSTKGTHVYKSEEKDTAISSLYINKESLSDKPPKMITVTVEES